MKPVVLMDVKMPVMDGLQSARIIKERWPGIRVIALTVHASYRVEARAAGADAFLVKGCPPEELSKTILNQ